MPRTAQANPEQATDNLAVMFDTLNKKLGKIPNVFRHMGASPAVLEAYLALSGASAKTSLDPKVREQIALIVAQQNNCGYCLAAHTAIGQSVGLTLDQTVAARNGQATDPKSQAIVSFAKEVVAKKAAIDDASVATLKKAGVNDQEIVETILVIVQNIFTNYFNHIVDPEIDFPAAPVA